MASAPSTSFHAHYKALIASSAIEADPAQRRAAEVLRCAGAATFDGYTPFRKQGLLGRLFADKDEPPPHGLYVHGEVGRGKTMLMDLFFQQSPVAHKRRAHFHEFMAEVHERIYAYRQNIARGEIADGDVIGLDGGRDLRRGVAALLRRVPRHRHRRCHDPRPPVRKAVRTRHRGRCDLQRRADDLYKGGLNRALFLPFIAQITGHMDVMRLDARTDFRLEKLAGAKMWLVPADGEADPR